MPRLASFVLIFLVMTGGFRAADHFGLGTGSTALLVGVLAGLMALVEHSLAKMLNRWTGRD